MTRPNPFALAATALLALDLLVRAAVGGPYLGATAILVTACGLVLVPLLPRELKSPVVCLAMVPALALGAFALALTLTSSVGMPMTEVSIRVSAAVLVLIAALVALGAPDAETREPVTGRQTGVLAALAAVFMLALASSWDVVQSFPPPGSDWGYYLHYAEEVRAQEQLLVENRDDPLGPDVWGNYPGLGALYGSALLLDGVSSRSLARGIALISALSAVSVFAGTAGLWGLGAGLLASATYSVSAIRLEPVYWHGLATAFALVFVPVVVLALGLVFRGAADRRSVGLLGFSLAGVAVAHSPSAFVAGITLAIAVGGGLTHAVLARSGVAWLRKGSWRPLVASAFVAGVLGAGVLVHFGRLRSALGSTVSASSYDSNWFDLDTLSYYFGWVFLALVFVSAVAVLASRSLRRDPATMSLVALALAALLVSQLWRVDVAFEYRRVVYYLGLAMVMTIGIAFVAVRARAPLLLVGAAVALVVMAQGSIGLRLPERLLARESTPSPTVDALAALGERLESDASDASIVVDSCVGVRARYLVGRPTFIAAEPWQAAFSNLLPAAEQAKAVVRGGREGRLAAEQLRAGYVVVDPRCTAEPAQGLGASVIYASDELEIIELGGT